MKMAAICSSGQSQLNLNSPAIRGTFPWSPLFHGGAMSFYGYLARLQESKLRWIVVGACIFGIIAFATMKHQAGYVLCGMIVLLGLNIALRLWKVPDSYKHHRS
jgi:hypothetical protein